MFRFLRKTKARAYNHIKIHKDRLMQNYAVLQKRSQGKQIGVVLKSNAYGHGIAQLVPICNELEVPMIFVDSLYEALVCKDAGVQAPVVIMGITAQENLAIKRYPFQFTAHDRQTLEQLVRYQKHAPIHLCINTGMNREGFALEEVPWIIEFITAHPEATIVGLMSHFAEADIEPETQRTQIQHQRFADGIQQFADADITFQYIHIDAAPSFTRQRKTIGNMVRMGKAFYGVADDPQSFKTYYQGLLPALEFTSTIVSLRTVKSGEWVGYGSVYQADKIKTIALIPAGYQEGVERRLSNRGVITVRGVQCPIVGKVSMNYTSVDVSAVPGAAVGDEVVVFSVDPEASNSLMNVSALCDTIPHEMMVRMDYTVRREVV